MFVDPVRPIALRRDPGSLLVCQTKILAGDRASVTLQRERPWASVTFSGTRHNIAVEWKGATGLAAVENLANLLPDHDFAIPGHFIADILVTEKSQSHLRFEALSIIDPLENTDD